jgi:cystathionine beta-lyase/cystathionine gamma-synthase
MDGFGGMIGLDLETAEAARTFVNSVKLCTLATSLGGVETILQPAATMTFASMPADERRRVGISDGLIRLSVGIEDVKDLENDILQALDKI